MTLVEIMAGFAILAIVVAVSLSIMLFASRVLSGDSARDRMKMLGDEMYGSLNRRLTFSTHVQLLAEGSDPAGAQYEKTSCSSRTGGCTRAGRKAPILPIQGGCLPGDGPDHAGRGGQIDDAPHLFVLLIGERGGAGV